jgi:chemotaxis methyl-accepting protein methylase
MIFPGELKHRFKKLIMSRCGLYFRDHDLKNLENAVESRMRSRGLDSVVSYYTHLTSSENREDEFREFLNLLTVHHTYFFRNQPLSSSRRRIWVDILRCVRVRMASAMSWKVS